MSSSPFTHPLFADLLADPALEKLMGFEAELSAMLSFESELTEACAAANLIPLSSVPLIKTACQNFQPDITQLSKGLARDGVVVPAFVKALRALLPKDVAPHLHFGATSQDVVDTALIIRLRNVVDLFVARLTDVLAQLDTRITNEGAAPFLAHTRMQQALPTTRGYKLSTWRAPLNHAREALHRQRAATLVLQLGGAVGDRAAYGDKAQQVADHLAALLGIPSSAASWHTDRSGLVMFAGRLAQLTGALGKIGMDVVLMTQNAQVQAVLEGAGGSSVMVHKQNPVRAEVLVALARYNATLVGAMHQALIHEQERSGMAWTLEWLTLPQMLATTGSALLIAKSVMRDLEFV